ncbi:MAG: molybdopterin molybdotransferase MoeA [Breznakibacter sp.]|nr:molybdopterin molybdotransferase MoeA [Breznakibacter sp.]
MAPRDITITEALSIIQKSIKAPSTETIHFKDALNRVLATDLVSKCDMPPFDKSAMDGYACKQSDLTKNLHIIGEIAAGGDFSIEVNEGEAVRIMTGAPIPKGANWVVMKEISRESDGEVYFEKTPSQSNICSKGEDLKKGDLILKKGTILTSREIAVITSAGYSDILVFQKPKVAIFATGNELIEPGMPLPEGKIYNSNGHQLMAEVMNMGLAATYLNIIPDNFNDVLTSLTEATEKYDLVILTGGVSVGDYDFIPLALRKLHFDIKFDTLSTKPGKHTVFANNGERYVLGLPGNPVSTLVQFEIVGKEIIYRMQGADALKTIQFKAPLSVDFKRKSADRLEYLPAKLNDNGEIELLCYNGSAHIAALTNATILITIPIGVQSVKKGDLLDARPL